MDFFDKLGETISSKSRDVAKKAKEITEVVSLNAKISTQEDIIKKAYYDIGKKYYETHKDEVNEFSSEFEIINHALKEIEIYKKEIQTIKSTKVCEACNEEVPLEASFCSKCGRKFEVKSMDIDSPSCGSDCACKEENAAISNDIVI